MGTVQIASFYFQILAKTNPTQQRYGKNMVEKWRSHEPIQHFISYRQEATLLKGFWKQMQKIYFGKHFRVAGSDDQIEF